MAQKLHLSVTIPEEYVLITKIEYEELLKKNENEVLQIEFDPGKMENIAWFKQQVGIKSSSVVKERILYPYRSELEDFVRYPEVRGSHWLFHKNMTLQWIENNFDKVAGRKKIK